MKYIVVFILLVFNNSVFSGPDSRKFKDCPMNLISLKEKHVSCFNTTQLALHTEEAFRQFIRNSNECPKCKEPIISDLSPKNYFKKKFLIIGISDHPFGGISLVLTFLGTDDFYSLWMYEIDENVYSPRELRIKYKVAMNRINSMLQEIPHLGDIWKGGL